MTGLVHLFDAGRSNRREGSSAACGAPAPESRIMSHHELKRGRITCPACLASVGHEAAIQWRKGCRFAVLRADGVVESQHVTKDAGVRGLDAYRRRYERRYHCDAPAMIASARLVTRGPHQ